jgi:hypothetical protein
MIARISTELACSADVAWQHLQRFETFEQVAWGLLGFEAEAPVPEQFQIGTVVVGRLWFLHFIPGWRHQIRIASVDQARRQWRTSEQGGLLQVWNHQIEIVPLSNQSSNYTDEIELDAGWLTWVNWIVTHLFFRYRQIRLRRLARRWQPAARKAL